MTCDFLVYIPLQEEVPESVQERIHLLEREYNVIFDTISHNKKILRTCARDKWPIMGEKPCFINHICNYRECEFCGVRAISSNTSSIEPSVYPFLLLRCRCGNTFRNRLIASSSARAREKNTHEYVDRDINELATRRMARAFTVIRFHSVVVLTTCSYLAVAKLRVVKT